MRTFLGWFSESSCSNRQAGKSDELQDEADFSANSLALSQHDPTITPSHIWKNKTWVIWLITLFMWFYATRFTLSATFTRTVLEFLCTIYAYELNACLGDLCQYTWQYTTCANGAKSQTPCIITQQNKLTWCPSILIYNLVCPAIPDTTPIGCCMCSRIGPCSIWTST